MLQVLLLPDDRTSEPDAEDNLHLVTPHTPFFTSVFSLLLNPELFKPALFLYTTSRVNRLLTAGDLKVSLVDEQK